MTEDSFDRWVSNANRIGFGSKVSGAGLARDVVIATIDSLDGLKRGCDSLGIKAPPAALVGVAAAIALTGAVLESLPRESADRESDELRRAWRDHASRPRRQSSPGELTQLAAEAADGPAMTPQWFDRDRLEREHGHPLPSVFLGALELPPARGGPTLELEVYELFGRTVALWITARGDVLRLARAFDA